MHQQMGVESSLLGGGASPVLSFALLVAVLCILGLQVAKLPWQTPTRESILRLLGIRLGYQTTIVVGDGAVAVDALVHHADAFSDRPAGMFPTSVLSDGHHHIINTVPYGPHWSALRRNLKSELLHPIRGLARAAAHRRRALAALVADISARSESRGTVVPVRECLHAALFPLSVAMCFGDGVDDKHAKALISSMRMTDFVPTLPDLRVFATFQKVAKLVYPERWRTLICARRRQEELYLTLIRARQEHRRTHGSGNDAGEALTTYVDSLVDLEVPAEVDSKGNYQGRRRRKLYDDEVVGLVIEYMSVTTGTIIPAIEWTLANLVVQPDIQHRLRGEIEADGGESCAYMQAVLMESLRRHPVVPFVLRHMSRDTLLGSRLVTRGSVVNFVVAKIGKDKTIWTSPEEFSPDRFMSGGEGSEVRLNSTISKETKMMMMPFGAGPRICPGMGYAMLHLEYFLANLVMAFEWHQAEGGVVDLKEKRGFFTTMQNPLRARVVPRTALVL